MLRLLPAQLRATLAILPWGYFLWSGYDLCYGSGAAPPNIGQVRLYVVAPAVVTAVGFILLALARKMPQWLSWTFFAVQILALLPLIAFWGGGI